MHRAVHPRDLEPGERHRDGGQHAQPGLRPARPHAFVIYRFDRRDRGALLWLGVCAFYILSGWIAGAVAFQWFPMMKGVTLSAFTLSFPATYLALCLTPVYLNAREDRRWRALGETENTNA